jgi:stalled ribosome alternative rescue factor ArfA|tara:strand:+ start:1421 stop:1555 length:135 start_codon:yes stop_codon:yes gene_type:complete
VTHRRIGNPIAKALRNAALRPRVVRSKKGRAAYKRNRKHRLRED